MKVKYLVVVAVLVLSALIVTFPAGSEVVAGEPSAYTDLDEQTRVLIGSSYCADMPLTEGGTDPSEMVKVSSDASGNNYIGYYSGSLYLVLDAPAWADGQESALPAFSLVFRENTYEIRAANLGADSSVTVIKLGSSNSGLIVEPIAGGVYVGSSSAPVISKSYCTLTSNDWLIYDATLQKYVGSANIKGHVVEVSQPAKLEMENGIFGTDFTGGAVTVSQTEGDVTYTMEMQPRIGDSPSSNTSYSLSFVNITGYPLQIGHSETTGRYSMLIHYTDTTGGDFSVQYDSVQDYQQNLYFNATKQGEVFLGSSGTPTAALSITNSADTPTLVYRSGEDTYYRYSGAAGYGSDIIVLLTQGKNAPELLEGDITLASGNSIRVKETAIGAVIGSVDLSVQGGEVQLSVATSDTFALDGRQYVASGDGNQVYVPYNYAEVSADLHGIELDAGQKIILGNGAMAFYEANGNTGTIERAIRNDSSTTSAANTVEVYNSTTDPFTVSTGDVNVFLTSYVSQDSALASPVRCSVTKAPLTATVDNDTGEFTVTNDGTIGEVIVKEAGERLVVSGITYTAITTSVFTGSDPNYVLESGQVSIVSNDPTSITIRRPDNSTLTVIGASQVTIGETSTFLFPAGSISIGAVTYEAVAESQFTLDSNDTLRMVYGRVTLLQNSSVRLPGTSYDMIFLASSDSGGEIQYSIDPTRKVSIHSGVFSFSLTSGGNSPTISLVGAGSGFSYNGSTYTYANSQADLNVNSGSVRFTGDNQSVSFDGSIITYQNSASRSYNSVRGAATITLNEGASAVPVLTAGTIQTEHLLIVNNITLDTYPGATVNYDGTVTLGPSKAITASATFNPPQGDPVTHSYTYTNASDSEDLVLLFTMDSDIIATLESGTVSIASSTPVTVADRQYTAVTSNAVVSIDNGAMVLQQGIVSATSHVWNGVLIEAVNSTSFRIDSSLNRITFNADAQLKFDGADAVYGFGSSNRLLVTSDGHVLLTDGTTMIPAGGSICFGTENKYYVVENIDDEYVTVFSAFTVTGIGDGKSVRITSDSSGVTVTRNGGNNDVSVSIYPSDGSVYISQNTGYVMIADFVMTDMTFRNGDTTVAGTGTLRVESRDSGITAAYSSGTFAVNGTLLFDTLSVSGEFSVAPDEALYDFTVAVSKSVTVTPDGEDPTEYANASSTDPLIIEYNSKTFTIYPSSGEYYVKANTAVTVGGISKVKLLSEESTDSMVVGVGSHNYIILSNGQRAEFTSMQGTSTFTYTAAADGTRFDITGTTGNWNALLTQGAASFGSNGDRDTLTLTDYSRNLTYTSESGAVIATHVVSSALYGQLVSGTATIPVDGGTSLIVADIEFLAAGEAATLTVSSGTPVLVNGGVDLNEGDTMLVGGVSITNVGDSDPDLFPDVEVHYDSTEGTRTVVFDSEGITVSTHVTADYSFTSTSNCQVSVADDGRFSASGGVFTLSNGETLVIGSITVTSSGTSVLSVNGDAFTVRSGSLTFSAPASFTVGGVEISGAVSVAISGSTTVSAPANGTIGFSSTTLYSYTNASGTDPLILTSNPEGGAFTPQSGSYYVYYGSPATVNGVTVSVGGQDGDHITVDAGSNTVTMANGQTVTFSNDTSVSYTAASDGTSFTVNALNDLPMISGSVTLSEGQQVIIGSTAYTAGSDQTVISSVGGTGVLTSGSVSFPAGSSLTVGSAAYTSVNGPAIISVTNDIAMLESGTVTLEGGASVNIGGVTVLNNGTVPFDVPTNGEITLPQGAKIRATLGSTSNDFTAVSQTEVRVESDGTISIISTDSLALAQGESVTIGNTVITADTASEISVSDEAFTLVSGTVSLSTVSAGSTSVRISGIVILGASSASVGTSTYVVGPAGGTLSINSETYQNASQTQTIKFTYESGAFVLSEGSYLTGVSGDESVTVNGFAIKSGSDTERLELTVGTDTVGTNGTVPVRIVKNNVTWTYGSPTNAVFTFGTNAVLTSGSVAVPDGIPLMIGDAEYYADGDDTVLSAESGKAVLVSGSVIVPDNASVTVLGTEFTAFNGSGAISLVISPSGNYAEIYQDSLSIVSADSLTVSLSQPGSLLKVGDSTYAYSDSTFSLGIAGTDVTMLSTEPWVTFNGAIIIGGVTYQSDGEASLCYNGTLCELRSGIISFAGTSASPVSLRIMTYTLSTESAVKIGLEEIQTEKVITLHSGSVTAASDIPLTVSGTAFNVGSGVTVTSSQNFTIPEQKSISFTVSATEITITGNGPEDLTYTHADSLLAIPAGSAAQLNISSTATVSFSITAVSDATVAVGTDVQELKSGSIELLRDQAVKIGSGLYTANGGATLGIESGTAVLLDGAVTIQGSAALKAGGTLFTAGSEGASMAYSDQTPRITEGSVTASGTFEISSEVVSYYFDGSGTYTVAVDPTDKSVSLTTSNDGTGGTMIKIRSGQEFMVLQEVSSATLSVKDVSATVAAPPTAKLLAGSAVLGENASVTVPVHRGSADTYILFYGGTPGEVRVEHQSLNSPIVTLKSGSISLDDGVDPTYTNTGTGEAAFVALGSNELSLKSGAITVPEGSTVWVGEKSITNTSGSVSVDSSGNITLGAQSHALIRDEFGGEYYLDNNGSEPMTQNVDQYVESHAFSGFNERREVCISSVQEMYRTGQSQKVRALIDSTVEKLRSAVYDSSISYEENLRMLDHMVMGLEEQIRGMFDPEQAFQDYKESIIEELEALHVGETSLSEQRIIDNAISSISSMSYNEQTYDDDMAAITEVLATVEKNLSGYRSSGSAAFIVLREILKNYVSTEPEDGFEAITSLKQQYTSALEDIQYLNNLSSDANLQRLNDLRDAFDGAVYSIHSTEYQKVKNTVLAEMNALYQSYPSPTAGELIDSAIAKVNLRAYDAQRVYTDNVNILSNLLANLKTNLSSTLLGNIETFNAYCDAFLERYTEAFAAYTEARETAEPAQQATIDEILGWIQEAKDKVDPTVEGHITYDTTKSLNDNINAVFAIAKNLEDDINNHINAQISNELDRVYNAARAHLNLNDREGVPTKLRDYIATTRIALETEYNSGDTAMAKGLAINGIMETYNTEMAVLIEQAEFYLNVDVGIKYLQDRYATSYAAVVSLMNTDIALLRALEYDTSKDMSQNLAELQERINNYSVALATLRKNTTQGDFENYREFRAWTVTEYLSDTSTQAEKDLANQYAASIRAVVFNGKSIESNRYAVDRLFSEFEGKYLALMADQRKGDFDALRNTLKSNIDAALLDGDGDSVRAAAERGKTWIGEFVFDRSVDYDTNSANITLIKDATILAIEYERSTDAAVKAAKVAQANSDILDLPGLIAAVNAQSAVDDSQKIRTILENARAAVSGISYDFSQSPRDNLSSAEAVMAQFSQDLYEQRLMENSTTVGGIRADGKTIDGKTADYPKDSDEIWGIVANATGIGDDASATISRVTPTLDPAAGTTFPASGSVANVLSNGKVLGAFDVTLYNGGERVTSFSGMYCIKILLPEDMRGFDSVQVAYVDEFGDVQIYDARVEGNYLVFETAHFSTFNVYGNIILHPHYDIYLYVVLIVLVVLLLVFLIRVVRYDANGGQGSTPATVFFCDGEGSLPENGFTREGYTFGGWSRKADGSDPISADAELSALGKIHFLKLYAVWNKEEVQQ